MTIIGKLTLLLVFGLASSCSVSDERVESSTSPLSANDSISSESVSSNLTDALEALSDSNISSTSTSLTLQDSATTRPTTTKTKSCSVAGDNAIVSINSSIEGNIEFSNSRRDVSRSITGSGTVNRTWSKTDATVLCSENEKHAAINWSADDIAGLTLSVSIDRSRETESTITRLSDNESSSRVKKTSVSGTRTVSWSSHTDNNDGTFTRVKSVSSSVTRSKTITSSVDASISLSMTVATEENAPLQITVVRNSTSRALISKKISSGTLRTSENESSHVLTDFQDYTLAFTDSSCVPSSGKLTASFYESGTEGAVKILELSVSDGSYTLNDITDPENPSEINDFDYDLCDINSFN